MSLPIEGNVEAYIDRKLNKYLSEFAAGAYSLDLVRAEFKAIILTAMQDDPEFYLLIGEGDAVTGDDYAGS